MSQHDFTEVAQGFLCDRDGHWYFSAAAIRRALLAINADKRAREISLLEGDGPAYIIGRLVEAGAAARRDKELHGLQRTELEKRLSNG